MKLSSLAGWTATLLALTLPCGYSDPGDLPDAVLQQIVDTYVGNAYRRGEATAFSVGITLNGNTFFKSYGFKSFGDTAPTNQINEHSIFELGSVTKVWTTALVGQATNLAPHRWKVANWQRDSRGALRTGHGTGGESSGIPGRIRHAKRCDYICLHKPR
jgi:hypothetical protein